MNRAVVTNDMRAAVWHRAALSRVERRIAEMNRVVPETRHTLSFFALRADTIGVVFQIKVEFSNGETIWRTFRSEDDALADEHNDPVPGLLWHVVSMYDPAKPIVPRSTP